MQKERIAKIIKIIDYLIEISILAIIFLVPLYFSFFYRDYSVFSLDKTAVFRVLVEILLILNLIKLTIKKEVLIYINKKHLFIVLPFFLFLFIATIFSIDRHNSLWGSYTRQQGLFTYLHYLAFFIILIINLNNKSKINRAINTALIASLFVALYGIAQWLGFDDFPWAKRIPIGGRVTSTFGQPVFLGNYFLFIIFLSIYKIISNKKFLNRFLIALLLASQFICLIFTGTRGAWVGLVSGVFIGIFLFFYIVKKRLLKIISVSVFLVAILAISFFLLISAYFGGSQNSFLSRIQSITDVNRGSAAMRFKYWQAGLRAISEKLVAGYGLENQKEVLIKYYDPSWSINETINTSPDRAHNEIMDILISGGLFLLVGYFLILFSTLILSIKNFKNLEKEDKLLLTFLLIGFFSYQFALLFSFSDTPTNAYFWLFLAMIFLILNNFNPNELVKIKNSNKINIYNLSVIIILLCCGLFYLIILNINAVRADYYFRQAKIGLVKNDYIKMFNNYQTALNLNKREEYYDWFFTMDLLDSIKKIDSKDYQQKVLQYLEERIKNNDDANSDFSALIKKAKILTMFGYYMDKKYFNEAEQTFEQLNKINPFYPDTYKSWGEMYMIAGNYEKALTIFNLSLSSLPNEDNPSIIWPEEHGEEIHAFKANIYYQIAYCYLKLNNHDNSISYYKKIIFLNPYQIDIYKKIADTYYLKGDLNSAIWYNKRGYILNPYDYNWPFAIALIYKEKGEKIKALEFANKALILASSDNDIKKLIKSLK